MPDIVSKQYQAFALKRRTLFIICLRYTEELSITKRIKIMFKQVINFWFNEIAPAKWWQKDTDFDQLVIDKFLPLHQQAMRAELYPWRSNAEGRLAEIIVLDQFSRNMFRDTPQAFSSDPLALTLAQEAIAVQADQALTPIQRSFLYMPFMHSESEIIHHLAAQLYKNNGIESNYNFELQHKKIIDQFGRYPHRNAILNRRSTEAELAFLAQPNSSF